MARWFVGCDHAGLALKRQLLVVLARWGDEVEDLGTQDESSVDYPAFGAEVGKRVAAHPGSKGLVVCATGIGISIAANKVAGVRAALVHDPYSAQLARAHNDCNVIAMGGRTIGPGVAEAALRAFRDATFEGGRHQRRIDQLADLDEVGRTSK
jgi:RpiB/LacA/LacB family sugar-phosphate isomerase